MPSAKGALSLDTRVELNQGPKMPILGLGVFQSEAGEETRSAVRHALDAGYRLIDTAAMYGNEADVGAAVRASGIPREEVFITTKLAYQHHGFESTLRAFEESRNRLGLDYVDLYLVHWPKAAEPSLRRETWRAMEKLHADGLCRAVGVSNYTIRHLEELRDSQLVPAVNQVEFHPFAFQHELLRYCTERGTRLEAYAPLTRNRRLDDPRILEIARRARHTPAQVLIRWGLQHGLIEIPKSTRPERILENAAVFDFSLTADDMQALDGLRDGWRAIAWDPETIP